jgi:hypothetical protein
MLCRDTNAQKWPPTVRFHEVVSAVIGLVRRGNREVLWVPTNVNLGNFLYHWLRAFKDQEAGLETLALTTPAMLPWLDHIPEARRLVIDPSQVRFIDRRVLGMLQDWNVDYGREELHRFVREILLPSGYLHHSPPHVLGAHDLVVNIRRGDYYSHPVHRQKYAFDQVDYLHRALETSHELDGDIPRIHVVTDDIAWCKQNLAWMTDYATDLTWCHRSETPRDNFATIAHAQRIVLTNSTFGYWAAYVSDVLHAETAKPTRVVAPWFHARIGDGKAEQLDPDWIAIRDERWEQDPSTQDIGLNP